MTATVNNSVVSSFALNDPRPPHAPAKPHEPVERTHGQMDRGSADRAEATINRHLPVFRAAKLTACLNLTQRRHRLGPWYAKIAANLRLHIEPRASICVKVHADNRGIVLSESHNPVAAIRGVRVETWSETAIPRRLDIRGGMPLLITDYTKVWYYFWRRNTLLTMNPLVNFADKIPRYYRATDMRRLSSADYREIYGSQPVNPALILPIPIIDDAVRTGRIPERISLATLVDFIGVWSRTWAKEHVPNNLEERIAREMTGAFTSSISGITVTAAIAPDVMALPGFVARFTDTDPPELRYVMSKGWPHRPDDSYMATATFSAKGAGRMPYHMKLSSTLRLDRLHLAPLFDVSSVTADVKARARIDEAGVETDVSLGALTARINPYRHGSDPHAPAPVETRGGHLYAGRSRDGFPSGIHLTRSSSGEMRLTMNLGARYELKTARGNIAVTGELLAALGGQWAGSKPPRLTAGDNHVEIRNFKLYGEKATSPLLANARLIITDKIDARKLLAAEHPTFKTGETGFIVRLEMEKVGGAYTRGYLVGFIPVPRDESDTHYDTQRFAMQETLNIAFGLVAQNADRLVKGDIMLKRIDTADVDGVPTPVEGIVARGNVVSIDKGIARDLLKGGSLKIFSRKTGGETRWFALIKADAIGLARGRIMHPSASASVALAVNGQAIDARVHRLAAQFSELRTHDLKVGGGRLTSQFTLRYNRQSSLLDISRLGAFFAFSRIAPTTLPAASRGNYSSFDMDGYLAGNWRHNLKSMKGSGFLMLRGDREGDIHLRDARGRRVGSTALGRETPLFSDTRWVMLNIDGVDRRGWLSGRFCLRTDIDLMALKPLGIRHADYVEWTMAHDNIGTIGGIIARSKKYYEDITRGTPLPAGDRKRVDYCRRVLANLK